VQAPELFQLPKKAHPMQFKGDPNAQKCNEKVDVWAVGVLVYELVYGRAPFAAKTPILTCNKIMEGFNGTFPDATVRYLPTASYSNCICTLHKQHTTWSCQAIAVWDVSHLNCCVSQFQQLCSAQSRGHSHLVWVGQR
jgi:serine/threonine protein kinase